MLHEQALFPFLRGPRRSTAPPSSPSPAALSLSRLHLRAGMVVRWLGALAAVESGRPGQDGCVMVVLGGEHSHGGSGGSGGQEGEEGGCLLAELRGGHSEPYPL
jgi:hypothetical protein